MRHKIIVGAEVNQPIQKVWEHWTKPEHIVNWNFAADSWCCPSAETDLKAGGKFSYRMEAKDGSMGFDYWGIFQEVEPLKNLEMQLGDERMVWVSFDKVNDTTTRITETFEIEDENSAEMQRQGWQNIVDNFKIYSEQH
ncbi:MAG: SRPBCC domain-containing protein [Saprospiraceae bacterium]|nr:SRPBCC domain-containing protein [Saprospiraceae bacterium]